MNFAKYDFSERRPFKDEFTTYKLYKFPNPEEILRVQWFENFRNEIDDNFEELRGCGTFRDLLECGVEHNYYIIKFVDEKAYEKAKGDFLNRITAIELSFKEDLFKEFDISRNVAEKIFNYISELSCNTFEFETIYEEFEKLVNLFKET